MDGFDFVEDAPNELVDILDQEMFKTEGWSRVIGTIDCCRRGLEFFRFIMAVEKKSGDPVGAISISKDLPSDGNPAGALFYIGGFYVKPEYRSIGIGRHLFEKAMALTAGFNVTLNASIHLVDLYKKKGFKYCREFRNAFTMIETDRIRLIKPAIPEDYVIKDISDVDFLKIGEYDITISGRSRAKYLQVWITEPHGRTKVALDSKSGTVVGLCSIHPQYLNRLVVGPFYADSPEVAESLFLSTLPNFDLSKYSHLILKFPECNNDVKKILEKVVDGPVEIVANGMTQFTKEYLKTDASKIYCLTETAHSFV